MNSEQVVRADVGAFNAGDWDRLASLFAPDAVIRGVLGWGGLDVALPVWKELHEGMSMKLTIDNLLADERTAAARYTESGRFVGPFRGLAGHEPTGAAYEIVAMEWFDFKDGLIARRWGARDSATIAKQVLG